MMYSMYRREYVMITRNILQLDNKSGKFLLIKINRKKNECFFFKAKVETSVRGVVNQYYPAPIAIYKSTAVVKGDTWG